MAKAGPAELSLDGLAADVGGQTTDAFALLADETRLAILLALWDAYDPQAETSSVRFSDIFERVDYDDPGNLRYHLEKLQGQFIRQEGPGGGYKIRTTGLKFVRSILAGAGVQDATVEPTEIDQGCPFCGAPTIISYRDGLVIHACSECEGSEPDRAPIDGLLSMVPFDPAGLTDRSPEEIRAASTVAAVRGAQTLFDGLCPACSGPVDGWFEYCPDHETSGTCANCGSKHVARARFECRICRNHKIEPLEQLALLHPAVTSFYDDHGISTRIRADDVETVNQFYELLDGHEVEVISQEPLQIEVTVCRDGDEIRLLFDDTVNVVDIRR